ncbi:hypothetical protein F2Q68_00044901 [Brassica cretica]|uniref:Uncharacterized protein n=2 Tax=Brassica cretica TaxID=69181 RepID=A0A3N6Q950_BRACR|nr:hypothetical protein F2Q68_00044901 [Brassica cretica]KAF3520662.1 hypothetical protein DY000_02061378 [Brassica cretica]
MLCNTSATNFPREMEFRGVKCSRFRDKYFIFAFYDEDVEPPDHVFLGICYLQMHWHDGLTSKDSTVHIKNTSGVNRCKASEVPHFWHPGDISSVHHIDVAKGRTD